MHEYLERCEFILPLFHSRWNGGQRLRSSGCPQVLYSVVHVPNERSTPVQRSTAAQLPPTTNEPTLPIRLPKQAKTRPRHPDSNNTEQPSHHIISKTKQQTQRAYTAPRKYPNAGQKQSKPQRTSCGEEGSERYSTAS
jgi:hypothetical protein